MFQHSLTTLKSGLPLLKVPMPSVASVAVLVLTNTGSRYEEPAQYGIAHFFEHMVFKGTEKYPQPMDLASMVDGIGANFNAFTSKEYTGYYVQSASKHLELALDVVSDMLMTPRLRQEDIDREKGVIIEELNMYVDNPGRHIANQFDETVFAPSGLAHNIVGTKETIAALSRTDFQKFLQQWYGLSNMVLIIAGDATVVNEISTDQLAEAAFSKNTGETRALGKVKLENYLEADPFSADRLHLEHRATEQAHFVLGWPSIKRNDPDRYALNLLSVALGGTMSSRLFDEVREKRGLCYYVHSDIDQYHNTGIFGASAGVEVARVEEALKVTIGEFTAVIDGTKPITDKELQRAKDYVFGKMVLGFEDSESVAQYYGMKQLLLGTIETPDQVVEKLKQVTLDDIQRVAQRLVKEKSLRLAVIGPYKERNMFEQVVQDF